VRVLLDTHALIWAITDPARLSRPASTTISNQANEILVSAASAWEIGTKVRLGKLPAAQAFEESLVETIESAGYSQLSIDIATALRAARLPGQHRDPFDRMLAAQALDLDIPIISADRQLDVFGIRRIW